MDGVRCVAPQLHPHRSGAVGGVYVDDTAAHGKLAGSLDLVAALIARDCEGGGQVFDRQRDPFF